MEQITGWKRGGGKNSGGDEGGGGVVRGVIAARPTELPGLGRVLRGVCHLVHRANITQTNVGGGQDEERSIAAEEKRCMVLDGEG